MKSIAYGIGMIIGIIIAIATCTGGSDEGGSALEAHEDRVNRVEQILDQR